MIAFWQNARNKWVFRPKNLSGRLSLFDRRFRVRKRCIILFRLNTKNYSHVHYPFLQFFLHFKHVPGAADRQPHQTVQEWGEPPPPSLPSETARRNTWQVYSGLDLAECGWDLAECGLWIRSSRVWMRSSRVWMRSSRVWMRSSRLVLTANDVVETGLGSILASCGIWGRQMKQCWISYRKRKNPKKSPL